MHAICTQVFIHANHMPLHTDRYVILLLDGILVCSHARAHTVETHSVRPVTFKKQCVICMHNMYAKWVRGGQIVGLDAWATHIRKWWNRAHNNNLYIRTYTWTILAGHTLPFGQLCAPCLVNVCLCDGCVNGRARHMHSQNTPTLFGSHLLRHP
jgi:hypothetical protein